ncbi:MAG: S8 family serine peptidase [Bacteroidales bacterium]|jgi:subtilisin family serine protease
MALTSSSFFWLPLQPLVIEDPMRYSFLILCILSLIAGCARVSAPVDNDDHNPIEQVSETIYSRTVRIRVTEELAAGRAVLDSYGAARTFPCSGRFEERTRLAGLHLWYDIEVDENVPLTKATRDIAQLDGVQVVENVPKTKRMDLPFDDPMLADQWHYKNEGSVKGQVAGSDINVYDAWSITTGDPGVIVAVIDGGVDFDHEDLKDNMWVNIPEFNGEPTVDDDNNGYVDDIYGYNFVSQSQYVRAENHGTHVAGTIAAKNNNGIGVSGIAGGDGTTDSGVRLMTCQIFDDYTQKNPDGAQAIKYAADNGAVICQNSWGFSDIDYLPQSSKEAIDYFVANAGIDEYGNQSGPMKGGIVIFAAGNDYSTVAFPASYDAVFSVAAIGADYKRAYYSNYGEWVDVSATGGDAKKGWLIRSTLIDDTYGDLQGTSMACPHVSGVAALVVSHFGGEGFTNEMLWDILLAGARDITSYNPDFEGLLGKGLIDAAASLNQSSKHAPDKVEELWTTVQSNNIILHWVVPADPDSDKAYGYHIYYGTVSLEGLDVTDLPAGVTETTTKTGLLNVGDTLHLTLTGFDFGTAYNFRVDAYDFSGNRSDLSDQVTAVTEQNSDPVITAMDGNSVILKMYEQKTLRFSVSDPDGHPWTYAFEGGSQAAKAARSNDVITVTFTGNKASEGRYNAFLEVEDTFGGLSSQSIEYEILSNTPPHVTGTPADVYFGSIGTVNTMDLDKYFTDDDGETLHYSISFQNNAVASGTVDNNNLNLKAKGYGLTRATVTASDIMGEKCSVTFLVLTRDGSQEVDLFPVPVTDILNVRLGIDTTAQLTLSGAAGAVVYQAEHVITPFQPAQLDLGTLSGGVYTLVITYNNTQITRSIVKL